ncbi:UDP-N-acetylmuramate--L-alanine ligase [Paenibacillus albiflavus]|uniref:UDP-N-acetylmuramate--L-alanine ligase n=1 Tax=Paenibacillus albiflavus TaxID=2545760 RepID=A0A4R4EIY0_9BACL|nr:UDP-N-acetylmuramate--L-alanine ligase [Paenibacillus albiflavus]TCZ79869.1 UDP-N-acetylmuramate--L-alanine ligase [Paenibacillus albiflavus]
MVRYHFIGIKGSGMSALAGILSDCGHEVQGEDIEEFIFTQKSLEHRNIPLYLFGSAPLDQGMMVIISNAYRDDHPSLVRCLELNVPYVRYHQFLGELIKQYTSIAITGAHGKTTTTGMLSHALRAVNPICSLVGDGTGMGDQNANLFVFESCEYKRHFLAYQPDIAVITNIDYDHPDYFSSVDDVRQAFEQMADQTQKQIIACGDDQQVRLLRTSTNILYYGFGEDNDLRAVNLNVHEQGVDFDVYDKNHFIDRFSISAFGNHNVLNALSIIGVSILLDLNLQVIKSQLGTFNGVQRRFTEKNWHSNVVIDDYAHHPTEVKVTIEAARSKYPNRKIVAIFQPHTYSRLEKLLEEFATSLADADEVYLCPIFGSARESQGSVSIDHLQALIPNAQLFPETLGKLASYTDSVLVFMGAGDIEKYQQMLFQNDSIHQT